MTATLPFTEAAVPAIAALLGVPATPAPYTVRGAAVYRLAVPNLSLSFDIIVLLWPSLARVDVRIGDCSIVYKGVTNLDLLPTVEAIFRRPSGDGYLFISTGGRASVVA